MADAECHVTCNHENKKLWNYSNISDNKEAGNLRTARLLFGREATFTHGELAT